jgi:hypothetical protein
MKNIKRFGLDDLASVLWVATYFLLYVGLVSTQTARLIFPIFITAYLVTHSHSKRSRNSDIARHELNINELQARIMYLESVCPSPVNRASTGLTPSPDR